MKTNWPTKKLGELVDFLDNQRKPINDEDRQKRVGPYPYYGANGQVGWIDDFIFDEDLVLLAEDGGYFGSKDRPIAYRIFGKTWVNNHAHVLRVKRGIAETGFIHYRLMFYDIKPYITGSTRTKLNKSAAEKIKIPLPPLEIQKQIVERLDKIAEARKLNDGLIQKTDELFQSLLHKELNPIRDSKHSNGVNPAGKKWEVKKMGEVFERITESLLPTKHPDKEFNFIGLENIESNTGQLVGVNPTKGKFIRSTKTVFRKNDVLYGKLRPYLNKVWLANTDGICSTDIWVLRAKQNIISSLLLSALLRQPQIVTKSSASMAGANLPRANKDVFDKITIPLPPLVTQKQIVAKLSAVQDYKKRLVDRKMKLKELFDSALHKSMAQ